MALDQLDKGQPIASRGGSNARRGGAAAVAERALRGVAHGRLARLPVTVRFWDGSVLPAASDGDCPTIVLRDRQAVAQIVREPNQLGLARAWVSGGLEVDGDLEAVLGLRERYRDVRVSAAERARLALAAIRLGGRKLLRRPPVPAVEARGHGRLHSKARDKEAVTYHYDVSNRFYRLVLGPSMVYSCAYFSSPDDTLEEAQERKLEAICRKLALAPDERLLDIGSGWGSLLLHAATRHRVRGVGVTLSELQAELARERLREAGVADRVDIRVADYRELRDEPFDKVASIGMYEHVGRSQLDVYARSVRDLLRPGGLFLNHGITRLTGKPGRPKSFIGRYVFPDGELHPVTEVMGAMRQAGLEARDVESLREHYALTLRRWCANLAANRDEAVAEAGPERERIWRLYMLGAAQAFESGDEISVYQVLASRGGAQHGLPLDRAALTATR